MSPHLRAPMEIHGTDIATVARVLGHASVSTTARYDRRDARAVQKALQARHVPYRRRT